MHHFQWSLDILDVFKSIQRSSNSTVKTKNLIFDKSCQRKPIEQSIESHKYRSFLIRLFFQLLSALISESEVYINLTILMISSDEMNLLRIEAFKSKQKTDGLDGMIASINKISKKDIIKILNILFLSILMRSSIECKETHKISKLSMNISKYFQRRLSLKNHRLTNNDLFCNIAKRNYIF